MKKVLYSSLFIFTILSSALFGQWQNKSFTFQGNLRQYRIYLPAIYNAANPVPLVLTLHGLGDNMTNFSGIGMNFIADTANFIVICPQALTDAVVGSTAWHSGAGQFGYYPNAAINDVAFMNALIDSTSAQYSINQNRIYSMGFSMGGFMTQRLACELSSRIAAIASMAGTIGTEISSTCNPTRPIPVAHFHGTADQTISYTANTYGMSVGPLINFWTNHNNTDATPIHTMLPDLVADGYTVEHDLYENGDQNSVVELFKVNNAGHSWLYPPANDISYSIEAWKFFSRFELNSSVGIKEIKNETMLIYPNPAQNSITIKVPNSNSKNNVKLFTFTGQEVLNLQLNEVEKTISLEGMQLSNGIYLLQVDTDGKRYTEKIILEN